MDTRRPAGDHPLSVKSHGAIKRRRISGITSEPGRTPNSLNIKNNETCLLIRELADLTGESMTGAVTEAVRQRLDRVRRKRGGSLADRLLAIGRDCAARLGEEYRALDHDALLYDEKGLPR